MTLEEWLACTNPKPMLEFLRGKVSDRKLRLIACACCRRIWDRITDERSRTAVEVAERFADGLATAGELHAACDAAHEASMAAAVLSATAWAAASAAGSASHPDAARIRGDGGAVGMAAYRGRAASRRWQCQVIRDVAGPFLFSPVSVAPVWLVWNDGIAPRLAQAIHDERAFDRLPILADALEDAGCTDRTILDHLRGPGPHVRGCWTIDLILSKDR
jgi:hypothetical protein